MLICDMCKKSEAEVSSTVDFSTVQLNLSTKFEHAFSKSSYTPVDLCASCLGIFGNPRRWAEISKVLK